MRWTVKDADMFLQAKDYVDSALIPMFPIDFENTLKSTVAMGEYVTALTYEVERQFKGRLMLVPSFVYLKEGDMDSYREEFERWKNHLAEKGFNHIFFITSDQAWKKYEQELGGGLFWLPVLTLENLDEQYKRQVIQDQIGQIIPLFVEKWQSYS